MDRWTDGNPLTYSEWYDPSQHGAVPTNLEAVVSELKAQPISDQLSRCTIMFPETGRLWSRWAKVPCHYPVELSSFICKTHINDHKMPTPLNSTYPSSYVDASHRLVYKAKWCNSGWLYWEGVCLKMLSTRNLEKELSPSEGSGLCQEHGGTVLIISQEKTTLEKLSYLIKSWNFLPNYGYIRLSVSGDQIMQYFIESVVDKTGNIDIKLHEMFFGSSPTASALPTVGEMFGTFPFKRISITPFKPRPWNVLCQQPIKSKIENACRPYQFRCTNGQCISLESHCNGRSDCAEGEDERNCTCDFRFFKCRNGGCIPMSQYCDHKSDCDDKSDELPCIYPECPSGFFRCLNGQCIPRNKRCDLILDCFDHSDERSCDWNDECLRAPNVTYRDSKVYKHLSTGPITVGRGFMCYSGDCIPASRFRNMRADCGGPGKQDEEITIIDSIPGMGMLRIGYIQRIPFKNNQPFCDHADFTRCSPKHSLCYRRSDMCVYDHDVFGDIKGCPYFQHLKHCKDHLCPGMMKCPGTYCIPHRKICDGIWDCPDGYDEMRCEEYTCPGLFRCSGEKKCIDMDEVCDGIVHCQNRDDEKFCDLDITKHLCTQSCKCHGYVTDCSDSLVYLSAIPRQTRTLSLTFTDIGLTPNMFNGFTYLARLNVSNNGIRRIKVNAFNGLMNLFELDLSRNSILELENGTFLPLVNLKRLFLHGNGLRKIMPGAFRGLEKLTTLDLSQQKLTYVSDDTFIGLSSLTILNLKKNAIIDIENDAFSGLQSLMSLVIRENNVQNIGQKSFLPLTNLTSLRTDAFKFCCMVDVQNCTPVADEFSSCDDLLANPTLQVMIWVMALTSLLGNLFVIIWRCAKGGLSTASALVLNLGVSDLLMGVYLLIIAIVDHTYRGSYIMHEEEWRNGFLCRSAGMLSMLSSEMSVFTMLVMTLDRVKAIVFPFRFNHLRLTLKSTLIVCACLWTFFLVLSVIPMFDGPYFDNFYGQNGVCLPFTLRNIKGSGWEYAMSIFNIINLAAFLIIAAGYLTLYNSVDNSRKNSGRELSISDLRLLRKISLIIISDFLCWVPIIVMSFLALGGVFIPGEVSAWVAVVILPINSAINPILYTIATINIEWKKHSRKHSMSETKNTALSVKSRT